MFDIFAAHPFDWGTHLATKHKKSTINISDSWSTSLKLSKILAKIRSFFVYHNIGYEKLNDQEILGTQGSSLSTHFFGGWLMSPANLPKKITIKLKTVDHTVKIETRIAENLGLEKMNSSLRAEHEEYFIELLDALKKEIPPST